MLKKKEKNKTTTITSNKCANPYGILSELMEILGNDKEENKQKAVNDNNEVHNWFMESS